MASKKQTTESADSAKHWLSEIDSALRREKTFRKEGREILEIYQGKKVETTPFNILYSNTETLSPALYNQKPRPVVKRRYDDKDPVALEAATMLRRGLEFLIDDINPAETGFSEAMIAAVTSALLPGRGLTRFRYNAEVQRDKENNPQKVTYEDIEIEDVPWEDFCHGYAKAWRYVPWCAYRMPAMTRAELIKEFGEQLGKEIPVKPPAELNNDGDEKQERNDRNVTAESYVAEVWEIWDKRTRKVIYVATGFPDKILKETAPPTDFKGFFPTPQPLVLFHSVGDLCPRALYTLYKSQADELNTMTRRIKAIIQALKVRGAYDATVSDMAKILEAEENKLVPVTNAAQLYSQAGGLDRAIWLWPIEKLQSTLVTLYQQREAAKQVLYEITGIADIMRGASVASETLGAQQIKTQWGTMRLKRMQAAVSTYVRNSLRLMAEILAENFTPDGLKRMTNTRLLPKVEKELLAQNIQAGITAPSPEIQAQLALPSLDEVQALLKDELSRLYRVDIETNSTVDVEATEDKEMIGEALNAIAQFMNGVAPLVESQALPMSVAKTILMSICRRFRFGEEVERALQSIPDQQPAPPSKPGEAAPSGPSPGQMQAETKAAEAKAQTVLLQEQARQRTIQMEMELAEAEHGYKMQELQTKSLQMQQNASLGTQQHVQRMQAASVPPMGQPRASKQTGKKP